MKRVAVLICLAVLSMAASCQTFVNSETEASLKDLEGKVFVMKNSLKVNKDSLNKGEKIKIKVISGKNWIKIRGYSESLDPLVAKQVLLLFLFDKDFPERKFSNEYLMDKLREIAIPYSKVDTKKKFGK